MRLRYRILLGVFLLAVAAGLVVYFAVPCEFYDARARQALLAYLHEYLGPQAALGKAELSWRGIELTDVSLPLDTAGSRVTFKTVTASLNPLRVLVSPGKIERAFGQVTFHRPQLFVAEDGLTGGNDTLAEILPSFSIPTPFYSILSRLDRSCRAFFYDGTVAVIRGTDTLTLVTNLRGDILCDLQGVRHLEAKGALLNQRATSVQLTAAAEPGEQTLDAILRFSFDGEAISSLPVLDSLRIRSGKGTGSLRLVARGTSSRLTGILNLNDLCADLPEYGEVKLSSVRAGLQGDTLGLSQLLVVSHGCTLRADGQVVLRKGAFWDIRGSIQSLRIENFAQAFFGDGKPLSGQLKADFTIDGEVQDPEAVVSMKGESVQLGPLNLRDLLARVQLTRSNVRLEQFAARTDIGSLKMSGDMSLAPKESLPIAAQGVLSLNTEAPRSKAVRVSQVALNIHGTLRHPQTSISVCDSSGERLLSGILEVRDGAWEFLSNTENTGDAFWIRFRAIDKTVSAEVFHAERLWAALAAEDMRDRLKPFEEVDGDFDIGRTSGRYTLSATLDSTQELGRTFSQIHGLTLRGSYARPQEGPLALLGGFEIEASQNLAGTFDVALTEDSVEIHELRLAELATMSGEFRPKQGELEADLDIHGIPLDLLPLPSAFLEKSQPAGTIAGHVRLCGPIKALDWMADLRLLDGKAFGTANYWATAELSGVGSHCDVSELTFGQDVERLFSASGSCNWAADSVELFVTSEQSVGRGILRILTGEQGWLDGVFDAHALIQGRLSSPTTHVSLSVSHGNILNDISFDTLTASVDWNFDDAGERELRVTNARIEKFGRYYLQGELEANPRAGGRLSGEITGDGEFLCILDGLASDFHAEKGEGTLRARIGGTWDKPRFQGAELSLVEAAFTFPDIAPDRIFADVNLRLSPSGVLEEGQMKFRSGSRYLILRTVRDSLDERYAGLHPIHVESPALDLGIIELVSDEGGMPLRFPGFMASDWTGNFIFGPQGGRSVTISQEDSHLVLSGDVALRDAMFTYPFLEGTGRTTKFTRWLLQELKEARWDLQIIPEEGNHYYAEYTGLRNSELFANWKDSPVWRNLADLLDRLEVDAELSSSVQGVRLEGTIADHTFHGVGQVLSSRGRVNYLDQTFNIDEVTADFDASDPRPVMQGRAETMAQDSLGRQVPVYLTLYVIDRETGIRAKQGRLDELSVVLESDVSSAPEEIMALLGYSLNNVGDEALRMGGAIVERAFHSRLLRPVERRVERWTGLDMFSLEPTMQSRYTRKRTANGAPADTLTQSFGVRYFTGSQLTAGKYLMRDLFFSYTGELAEGEQMGLEGKRLGLVHLWTIEYRMRPLSPDLVVDFSVEYDNLERKRDESVGLKYTFALEP
jgi:hypothetical protein